DRRWQCATMRTTRLWRAGGASARRNGVERDASTRPLVLPPSAVEESCPPEVGLLVTVIGLAPRDGRGGPGSGLPQLCLPPPFPVSATCPAFPSRDLHIIAGERDHVNTLDTPTPYDLISIRVGGQATARSRVPMGVYSDDRRPTGRVSL